MSDTPPKKPRGECYGGACDGKEFDFAEGMKRVKLMCSQKRAHIYVHHPVMSEERGKPMFLFEGIEAWKV